MHDITVEFLAFDGCPLAPNALRHLERAVDQLRGRMIIAIRHVDLMDPATPELMKRWGSPTILLNGRDISGTEPGDANSCRISSSPGGVPSEKEIVTALTKESGS